MPKIIYTGMLLILLLLSGCQDQVANVTRIIPPSTENNPYDGVLYRKLLNYTDCDHLCEDLKSEFQCWDTVPNFITPIKKCECSLLYCKVEVR